MAEQKTPRVGLTIHSEGTDEWPGREKTNAETILLDSLVALYGQGPTQSRPPAGVPGRHYYDETDGREYYDTGAKWVSVTKAGGGGAAKPVQIGGTGSAGSSDAAAPWDHVHTIPFATSTTSGAMSREFAAMLENATSTLTGNTIPIRGSGGQLTVGSPTASSHAATKGYVDSVAGGSQVSATTMPDPDTIPKRGASGTFRVGLGGHADDVMPKSYIDGLGSAYASEGVMRRWSGGQTDVANPTANQHATNMGWVNSRLTNLEIDGGQVRKSGNPIFRELITGSMEAWNRTSPSTSSWATVVVSSNGVFSRYGSSLSLKENIRRFVLTRTDAEGRTLSPLQAVRLLQGVIFDYINGAKDQIGFIADDVAEIVPELVVTYEDGVLGLHYELFVVLLVEALQELLVEIEAQQRADAERFQRIEDILRRIAPEEFPEDPQTGV